MIVHTYSPVRLPLNWQSELIESNSQRYALLKKVVNDSDTLSDFEIKENPWLTGYGTLEHDNLPLLYQMCAQIIPSNLINEVDVQDAALYCYDNCLAVLYVSLSIEAGSIGCIQDAEITARINSLSEKHLSPLFTELYEYSGENVLIPPRNYVFFKDTKSDFTSATPLWVARMLLKPEGRNHEEYQSWLQNTDVGSDYLLLGSGNSLVVDNSAKFDVHRVMVVSQFHAALMERIEKVLKHSLSKFNSAYFDKSIIGELKKEVTIHQQRNDHIEFVGIQYSAAGSGMQGRRRAIFQQFEEAYMVADQQARVDKLSSLIQQRLDRLMSEKFATQNRAIQTLLAFLGALSLVGLIVDLAGLHSAESHNDTYGVLDLFHIIATENILNITIILVVLLTLYFYRNHE